MLKITLRDYRNWLKQGAKAFAVHQVVNSTGWKIGQWVTEEEAHSMLCKGIEVTIIHHNED